MLTRLRFKNWRSLRDVTLDNLTPITVFVGANSSGKTNIIDALSFFQDMLKTNTPKAFYYGSNRQQFHTLGTDTNSPIELELAFKPIDTNVELTYTLAVKADEQEVHFVETVKNSAHEFKLTAEDGKGQPVNGVGFHTDYADPPLLLSTVGRPGMDNLLQITKIKSEGIDQPLHYGDLYTFIAQRWEFFGENFRPINAISSMDRSDPYSMDRSGTNVPAIIDQMITRHHDVFEQLHSDAIFLLDHLKKLDIEQFGQELRLMLTEKVYSNQTAPTISAGTVRLIAILAAYYVLDMRNESQPGLVIFEEPDTAVHPLLLGKFVELLRIYTERGNRQFILTTHNPMLLNLFKPEEVRIVERDEQGVTTVNPVNQDVVNVWYDKYGEYSIGDVWTTRLLGGVPE